MKHLTITPNLIVIGGGSAGMTCAIAAAQRGAKVLVIEKSNEIGGTLHFTAGHLSGGGTRWQKNKGIEDSPEAHYADIMRISEHTADPTIARLATTLAPQLIDWLQDNGYQFDATSPKIIYGHVPYSIPRTHFGGADYAGGNINGAGMAVFSVLKPLFDAEVAKGNIEVWYGWKLADFYTDEDEQEILALDLMEEGTPVYLTHTKMLPTRQAKVVVCTGGYAANHALFQQLHPEAPRLVTTAKDTSMGEGLAAAMRIGAKFRNGNKHSSTLGGIELEPKSGRTDFWKVWARVSNAYDRFPREIYVNEAGERFMDETEVNADTRERAVLQQPNRRFWAIFDEAALHTGDCIIPQWTPEQIRQEAQNERAIWVADTIEALAQKIGVPADALLKTVSEYNSQAERYRQLHPVGAGPFYAILTYAFSLISFGGVEVNADLQVLNDKSQPFINLFAAGEILGAGATSGKAFCGGMLLTPALAFGKYLGENWDK